MGQTRVRRQLTYGLALVPPVVLVAAAGWAFLGESDESAGPSFATPPPAVAGPVDPAPAGGDAGPIAPRPTPPPQRMASTPTPTPAPAAGEGEGGQTEIRRRLLALREVVTDRRQRLLLTQFERLLDEQHARDHPNVLPPEAERRLESVLERAVHDDLRERRRAARLLYTLFPADRARDKLVEMLVDEDAQVRSVAANSLSRWSDSSEELLNHLDAEEDPRVKTAFLLALGRQGPPEVVDALMRYLEEPGLARQAEVAIRQICQRTGTTLPPNLANTVAETMRRAAGAPAPGPR